MRDLIGLWLRYARSMTGSRLSPHIRQIESPVTRSLLRPLTTERVVQFRTPLTDREYGRVGRLLTGHSDVALRAYGVHITDLEFLAHFPHVRRFQADYLSKLESLDGLRHLPEDLESLTLGEAKTARQFSLRILERFTELRELYVERHTKDIEVIGALTRLEDLTLRSITLPDLAILLPLTRLRSLELKLGGTKNLSLLPEIGRLRYLELWQVRGLSDISPVADLPHLQYLFLQSLRQVTQLPVMTGLPALRRVVLDTMKGITDLRPLAGAPALEQLLLLAMRQVTLEDLQCLAGHLTLREAVFGLGSMKRNAAAYELVGVSQLASDFEFT